MATIAPTFIDGDAKTTIAQWVLGAGDDGQPIRWAGAADRTVQVIGSFGGATVTMQGTLEQVPTTWASLTDIQGNAIAMTAAGIETITELTRYIRPIVAGGTGTAVTVMLLMRVTV